MFKKLLFIGIVKTKKIVNIIFSIFFFCVFNEKYIYIFSVIYMRKILSKSIAMRCNVKDNENHKL